MLCIYLSFGAKCTWLTAAAGGMTDELERADLEAKINSSEAMPLETSIFLEHGGCVLCFLVI